MSAIQHLAPSILSKYNINGPRYTSYPTALEFHSEFTDVDLIQAIKSSERRDLALYLHIPFCHSLCYYCGCNKIVTRHRDKANDYLDKLIQEIETKADHFKDYRVRQLHLGGGTPSFLTPSQFSRLMQALRQHFPFAEKVEMGIEIDPREIELELLDHLRRLGFNRLSFGLQDTNKEVQEAINRVQDTEFVAQLINRGRTLGFESINLDVIYGLPHQTPERFNKTLEDVIRLDPNRISLFSYAHLPERFSAQRKIKDAWLPQGQAKMDLMLQAVGKLTQTGYIAIGMDHFAKPDDELAQAQVRGELHRNFQGYTTLGNCDLLGLGVSAISAIGKVFSQNEKHLKSYYQQIDSQGSAIDKGLVLSRDDLIRAALIKQLMCNFSLDIPQFEADWQLNFGQYFEAELANLSPFIADALVDFTPHTLEILGAGRLLVRTICMTFDKYMAKQVNKQRFSRVI